MSIHVGVQLAPQATTTDELRRSWRLADSEGLDSIWVWDHFFPLYGDPEAAHFEGWTLLAAMAVETTRARFEQADAWNTFGPPEHWAHKNRVLDEWCEKVGRDPAQIERTVAIEPSDVARVEEYAEAGVEHIIVMLGTPFDLDPVLEAKAILTD